MTNKVKIVPISDLERMHTGSLISRRVELLKCEESFRASDRYGYEDEPDPEQSGYIEFKDQSLWSVAYREVKEVLANREHVPSAAEKKQRRHEQAKKK